MLGNIPILITSNLVPFKLEPFAISAKGDRERYLVDKENFDSYDTSQDGRLSREEARSWVLPDHSGAAVDEAEHLISETDFNKDGKLTKQEIVDNHYLCVGSAATDYGSHLQKMRHDPSEL